MLPVVRVSVLFRPANNFLGKIKGNASEGKYITVNNNTSGVVTIQKCLKMGITYFDLKIATIHNHLILLQRLYLGNRVRESGASFNIFNILVFLQVIVNFMIKVILSS